MPIEKIQNNQHKFGVEIEMTGLTREQVAKILAEYFKTSYSILETVPDKTEKYKDQFKIVDKNNGVWKVVADNTISCENGDQIELVTPILTWKDTKILGNVISKLRGAGATVNSSCGIHIHVDASVHNFESVKCLINTINNNQDLLLNVFNVENYRKKFYCHKLYSCSVATLNVITRECNKDMKSIKFLFDNKNHILNFRNISDDKNAEKNTIEFRFFNSTLDEKRIKAYIMFTLAMSAYSINRQNVISSALRTFKSIKTKDSQEYNKFAFFELLKQIGLTSKVGEIVTGLKISTKPKSSIEDEAAITIL